MQTNYWEIMQNLRRLLQDPNLITKFGLAGFKWVNENYDDEKNRQVLLGYLDSIQDD